MFGNKLTFKSSGISEAFATARKRKGGHEGRKGRVVSVWGVRSVGGVRGEEGELARADTPE